MSIDFETIPDTDGFFDFFSVHVSDGDRYICKTFNGGIVEGKADVDEYASIIDDADEIIDAERVKPASATDRISLRIRATANDLPYLLEQLEQLSELHKTGPEEVSN